MAINFDINHKQVNYILIFNPYDFQGAGGGGGH